MDGKRWSTGDSREREVAEGTGNGEDCAWDPTYSSYENRWMSLVDFTFLANLSLSSACHVSLEHAGVYCMCDCALNNGANGTSDHNRYFHHSNAASCVNQSINQSFICSSKV